MKTTKSFKTPDLEVHITGVDMTTAFDLTDVKTCLTKTQKNVIGEDNFQTIHILAF